LTIFAPAVLLFIFRHPGDMDDIKHICWAFLIFRSIHYVFCVGPIGSPYAIPVFPTITFLGSIFCSLTIVIMALMSKTATVPGSELIGQGPAW